MWLTVGQHHVTASAFQGFVIAPGSAVSWTYTVTEPKCGRPITALNAPSPVVSVAPALAITQPALAETGSNTGPALAAGLGLLALGLAVTGWSFYVERRNKGRRV